MKYAKPFKPEGMVQVELYRNDKEFCSWPFNAGMWKIDENNILVGFMNIPCDYSVPGTLNHDRVETFGKIKAVRTRDGGRTWSGPIEIADNIRLQDELRYGRRHEFSEPFDFRDKNTLLECWCTPNSAVDWAQPWVKMSRDGGETWSEAVMLPDCGIPRYQGRPSYIVRPDGVVLLFLTARPKNNPHDRPVVFASFDDGRNWSLVSMMPNAQEYRMICPSPVILKDGTILVAVRVKPAMTAAWDELFASDDGGLTWRFVSRINDHGDTVHLTLQEDGRLFAVYGYRRPSFGIRARVSEDNGLTWGPEMILRDDGGSIDLGYPRAVEVRPGEILATYYFNDKDDPIQQRGGVRYIGGTILKV
ncbi:sialidase family protein [Cohnella caldifontis]|uniref:sialidase family protein n=1 Tax=Cohnella caldifontis TaxID=3027471 RepID=UPI0023ED4666|nr:sialidase family protein [Cohnella sp. YIM B05605]